MLRCSLGLAVRTFWGDLEKCPKSATGQILGGSGQHFGAGTFWDQFWVPTNTCAMEGFWGVALGESL